MMDWVRFFLAGWGATFTAYVALQAITLLTLKRPAWYFAALAVLPMGCVVVATFAAHAQESNLWPVVMIFASPLAVLYLLVAGIAGLNTQEHPHKRALMAVMVGVTLAACVPYVLIFA